MATSYSRAAVEADPRANRAGGRLRCLNYETVKYFKQRAHETARYDESLRRLEDANVLAQKDAALLNLWPDGDRGDRRDRDDVARRPPVSSAAADGRRLVMVNAICCSCPSPLFFSA